MYYKVSDLVYVEFLTSKESLFSVTVLVSIIQLTKIDGKLRSLDDRDYNSVRQHTLTNVYSTLIQC
mgnify:CR=1 FL=1